eukprot:6190196-Pleurochrysis_carterae.AAC.2
MDLAAACVNAFATGTRVRQRSTLMRRFAHLIDRAGADGDDHHAPPFPRESVKSQCGGSCKYVRAVAPQLESTDRHSAQQPKAEQ